MKKIVDQESLEAIAAKIAGLLAGGEVLELVGDVGAGKTTFTKALAASMKITDVVQSPTFTISNRYDTPNGLILVHYDFYRLIDPGVMKDELAETVQDEQTVTVLEWGGIVNDVLPEDRLTIQLVPVSEAARQVSISSGGPLSQKLLEKIL